MYVWFMCFSAPLGVVVDSRIVLLRISCVFVFGSVYVATKENFARETRGSRSASRKTTFIPHQEGMKHANFLLESCSPMRSLAKNETRSISRSHLRHEFVATAEGEVRAPVSINHLELYAMLHVPCLSGVGA